MNWSDSRAVRAGVGCEYKGPSTPVIKGWVKEMRLTLSARFFAGVM